MQIDFNILNFIFWGLTGIIVSIIFDKKIPKFMYFCCWVELMCHLFEKI